MIKCLNKIILIFIISFVWTACYNQETIVDKSKLLGFDIRLYQNTSAWNLAKAVNEEDIKSIKQEVLDNKVNVDLKEERFGQTLLSMAIRNNKYKSVKTLLELGADPNVANSYEGTTPIIEAADNDDPKYLELLLKFKGNPNSYEDAPPLEGNIPRKTALIAAISFMDENSLEKVKMLLDAGADIESNNKGRTGTPLIHALTMDKMDVVLYLLEKGVEYNGILYTMHEGQQISILGALRKSFIDLDSEQYQYKLKVIAFLKKKGLDYNNEPIPNYLLAQIKNMHPDDWKEYIEKY